MRTLDSEELKLVYGGTGKPSDCKPDKKPSCNSSRPSCNSSRPDKCDKKKINHGNHYGWCNKK